jgi:hypothetical protein
MTQHPISHTSLAITAIGCIVLPFILPAISSSALTYAVIGVLGVIPLTLAARSAWGTFALGTSRAGSGSLLVNAMLCIVLWLGSLLWLAPTRCAAHAEARAVADANARRARLDGLYQHLRIQQTDHLKPLPTNYSALWQQFPSVREFLVDRADERAATIARMDEMTDEGQRSALLASASGLSWVGGGRSFADRPPVPLFVWSRSGFETSLILFNTGEVRDVSKQEAESYISKLQNTGLASEGRPATSELER